MGKTFFYVRKADKPDYRLNVRENPDPWKPDEFCFSEVLPPKLFYTEDVAQLNVDSVNRRRAKENKPKLKLEIVPVEM